MIFDAPINDGANLFIWIVCILAGLGAAVGFADHLKTFRQNKDTEE